MDAERQMIINALNSNEAKLFMYQKAVRVAKHELLSTQSRKDAVVFHQTYKHCSKTHGQIWNNYSSSISYGPSESEELALGYEGRSGFFIHIRKYEESLHDIEKALKITKSTALKVKLLCRKAECLVALNIPEKRNALEKAKFWLGKIERNDKEKKQLISIVNKTQKIVENGQAVTVKVEDKSEILETLSKKETENTSKSIAIRYDEKYGRHLVAARNIKPGEIICVQKPYVMNSNTELLPYVYCCHCLKVSWISIPCDTCGWTFFCSEKCRNEAWQQYHDMECSVMPRVRNSAECKYWRQLTIRTVIVAIKETGSIAELRSELEEVDKCTDKRTKGFSKNGKFEGNKFRSLYSLSHRWSSNLSKVHVKDAVRILISFIKYTTLFGEANKFKIISELLENEDVIFVGSLILRLFATFSVNYQEILEKNVLCEKKHDRKLCLKERCCYRGTAATPLLSLINHSCNPNVAMMLTDASKMVVYALKPIKKNVQIFQSYSGCGLFYERSKADRQWMTKNAYNFTCDCLSCQEDWPSLEKMNQAGETALANISKPDKISPEMLKKITNLIESMKQKKAHFNEQTIKELGNAIEVATNNYTEPSYIICSLIDTLIRVYDKLYLSRIRITSRCYN